MAKDSKRQPRSFAELCVWSDEHLAYEFQQFKHTCNLLISKKYWRLSQNASQPLKDEYLTIHNSLVESCVIHSRTLLAFFFDENRNRETDALAQDFFDDPSAWELIVEAHQLRRELTFFDIKERVGYEAAHLSYKRRSPAEKDDWTWREIYSAFVHVIELFIMNVPPGRISSKVYKFLDGFRT